MEKLVRAPGSLICSAAVVRPVKRSYPTTDCSNGVAIVGPLRGVTEELPKSRVGFRQEGSHLKPPKVPSR